MSYIRKSIQKLKDDFLSKGIYDLLKYIVGALALLIAAKLIPNSTSLGTIINTQIALSILNLFLLIFLSVGMTLFLTLLQSRKKYKELKKDSHTDELTGTLNKKAFMELLPKTIENCRNHQIKLSLIIIDIDNFKEFNDEHGYENADKVLAKVGDLLKSDNRATDMLFRQYFKGDEFIIIAKETELANAIRAANRKKDLFSTGFEVDGNTYYITVCCGVIEYNFNTDDQESALLRLGRALKSAKSKTNKNSVEALM